MPYDNAKKTSCFGPSGVNYNMGYNHAMLPDLQLGEIVRLRKPHPCGGYEWKVIRLGADIGLECLTCQHRVLLTRRELVRRMKHIVPSPEKK
jgi:hypothetical protein